MIRWEMTSNEITPLLKRGRGKRKSFIYKSIFYIFGILSIDTNW